MNTCIVKIKINKIWVIFIDFLPYGPSGMTPSFCEIVRAERAI